MSEIKVNSIKGVGASAAAITVNNSDGTCTANITNNLSNRNKVINGSMICSQRGSSFTSDGFTLDRFERQQSSDGAFTVTQSTTSPDGFAKSLKVDVTTADTSLAAAQFAQIKYKIEAQDLQDLAFGTSAAKTVTLSFYVRSNKTGNYAFAIMQSDNSFKMASFQYTINSADTWERKTITIAGDTSGVINDDTGDGFILQWALAAGTDLTSGSLRSTFTTRVAADQYAGQGVNLLDSTSNEWYITGVQFEVNSSGVATDFEHRSFGQELALCKRYYQQFPQSPADTYGPIGSGRIRSSTNAHIIVFFPEMRSTPTCTKVGNLRILHAATSTGVNSVASSHMARNVIFIEGIVSSGLTQGEGCMMTVNNDTNGKITLAAEL